MTAVNTMTNNPVTRAYRKGWLAWLGANKAAFNYAQDGVQKLQASRAQLVEDLVAKGESVETQAQEGVEFAKQYIKPRFENVRGSVSTAKNKLFTPGEDTTAEQIEVLTEAIANLTKTVGELSDKVNTPRTRTSKKAAAKDDAVEA